MVLTCGGRDGDFAKLKTLFLHFLLIFSFALGARAMSQARLEAGGVGTSDQKGQLGEDLHRKMMKINEPDSRCIKDHIRANEPGPDAIYEGKNGVETHEVKSSNHGHANKSKLKIEPNSKRPYAIYELSDEWLENNLVEPELSKAKKGKRYVHSYDLETETWKKIRVRPDPKNPRGIIWDEVVKEGKIPLQALEGVLDDFPQSISTRTGVIKKPLLLKVKGASTHSKALELAKKQALKSRLPISGVYHGAGYFTKDGKLATFLTKSPWGESVIVLAVEGGVALYQRSQGNISQHQFNRMMIGTAFKSAAVGGASHVAVFLGATPGGWVVLGVATGAYFIADEAYNLWEERRRNKFLSPGDLRGLGIEIESVLGYYNPQAPLNFRNPQAPFNFRNPQAPLNRF